MLVSDGVVSNGQLVLHVDFDGLFDSDEGKYTQTFTNIPNSETFTNTHSELVYCRRGLDVR